MFNGLRSPLLEVKYGVSQGSLAGPRLYSIYANDFSGTVTQRPMLFVIVLAMWYKAQSTFSRNLFLVRGQ